MLATEDSETFKRTMLLGKLAHALDRHAYSEEHVIYPALRESDSISDAETLETEHGEVKEFLYRLKHMEADDPAWLDTVREFRTAVEAEAVHAGSADIPVTVSAGVAVARASDADFDHVLRRADRALYRAKRRGRNRVVAAEE